MRVGEICAEVLRSVRAMVVSTVLVAAVAALTGAVTVAIVGRNISTEEELLARLAMPEARMMQVMNPSNDNYSLAEVEIVSSISTLESMLALGSIVDVRNGALGQGSDPVALAQLWSSGAPVIELSSGRMPHAGEAIVGTEALERLRLSGGYGYVEDSAGRQWAIVGTFVAHPPVTDLSTMVLAAVDDNDFTQLRLVADSLSHVPAMEQAALSAIGSREGVTIRSASTQAENNLAVLDNVAASAKTSLLMIQGAGAIFIFIVVLADVLINAKDLGRRRTLGISRATLIVLVVGRACVQTCIGALAGAVITYITLHVRAVGVPLDFALATVILTVICAAIASCGPAIIASRRDPVRVMRTA
ncbi:hypothetical protein [Trueperella sp. LYQ141]|uniref:hypothetical protein n=1 Tax=Trueperella sp. LYQ141 TaxID=3391058 RepID=UPI003982E64D